MNNKIKLVRHRSFGFRTVDNLTAAIYHCCAHLPLPKGCWSHFWETNLLVRSSFKHNRRTTETKGSPASVRQRYLSCRQGVLEVTRIILHSRFQNEADGGWDQASANAGRNHDRVCCSRFPFRQK